MAVTAERLAALTGVDATRAGELLAAVTALVNRYAPDAPEAIRDEATIRAAGWLAEAPASGIRSESAGPVDTTFSPSMTGCLAASGAKGLLAPWRERRAGAAG